MNTATPEVENPQTRARLPAAAVAALGIVYGDIGTSPLYALRESLFGDANLVIGPSTVLGVLSLIFWALVLTISVKYLMLVMRADNRGEGGILALLALLDPWGRRGSRRATLLILVGLFGAALLYGDAMITPAISVLSAVEGLKVAAPGLGELVIPITVVILIGLFVLQEHGSARIGALFGPVMVLWFGLLATLGIAGIAGNPQVLTAVNPMYALRFLAQEGSVAFAVLGGVFLVVTGGEALYADMGHFGRQPIRVAWFTLVLPALLLNYFGQGAWILSHPSDAHHPFFNLVPAWGVYPMVGMATIVTVIASQAVISGTFSLTRQAVQLGQSPRVEIIQTSSEEIGQIYIPSVNWMLMFATIALVFGFQSSSALAAAYGIAVSATMVITTVLVFFLMRNRWHWPAPLAIAVAAVFLVIDATFFSANLFKINDGGWLPLLVGVIVLLAMTTWSRGRTLLQGIAQERSVPARQLITSLQHHQPARVAGTAVFLTSPGDNVSGGLLHHLKLNQVLHERVILLTVVTEDIPRVPATARLEVTPLEDGFYRILVHYGFMQSPNVPVAIRLCQDMELIPGMDADTTVYYADRITLQLSDRHQPMPRWQRWLFTFMSRNSLRAVVYYQLPTGRSVELGIQVEM